MAEQETIAFDVEVTDTFGGEANYSWVRRGVIRIPASLPYASKAYRLAKVKAAKAFAGWTGQRCEVADHGDMLDIRPRNACMVCFVTYREGE